jgi:hypothetical protein
MIRFKALFYNDVAFVIGASALSALAGAGVSYLITKRHLTKKHDRLYTEYRTVQRHIVEISVEPESEPEPEPLDDGMWTYEDELTIRDEEKPFVISDEEFNVEFPEYDKLSFEYYEKEDILLDENKDIFPEVDKFVGDQNLIRFGFLSNDPRIVYIRNHDMETDYEISLREGSYTEEVLGYIEHDEKRRLRHPHRRDVLKFRREEE